MKITVDFENGVVMNLAPTNLFLSNLGADKIALSFKTDDITGVPIAYWNGQLATEAEIAARPKANPQAGTPATPPVPPAPPAVEPPAADPGR